MGLAEAYNAVVAACNDPNIGYWAGSPRSTITLGVSYKTYCDCSSLMSWALWQGGYLTACPWFTTTYQPGYMVQAGWTAYSPYEVSWQPGDILWRAEHTEMVYEANGNTGRTMGAHGRDNRAWVDQVSIKDTWDSASSWTTLYRAPDSFTPGLNISWSQGDGSWNSLSEEQIYNNGALINYWLRHNFETVTDEAVAGVLGNFMHESQFDPNMWYGGIIGSVAYGLPQFNPSSSFRAFAVSEGIDLDDADQNGPFQLECIFKQRYPGWLPTSDYPYTIEEYLALTDVDLATRAFYEEFERGGSENYNTQPTLARYWLEQIPGFPSNIGQSTFSKYFPLWAYQNLRWRKILR